MLYVVVAVRVSVYVCECVYVSACMLCVLVKNNVNGMCVIVFLF